MLSIEELLDELIASPERVDDSLVAELAAHGVDVVGPLLDRAARVSRIEARRLERVIDALDDPKSAASLIAAFQTRSLKALRTSIIRALGRLGDRGAVPGLLADMTRRAYGARIPAEALADIGAAEVTSELTQRLHELLGSDSSEVSVLDRARAIGHDQVYDAAGLIRALAKLGDFSAAPYAIALSSRAWCDPAPRSELEEAELGQTYVMIAETISACPGPGSQAALIAMTGDENHEVRIKAIRTLLRLGTQTAIDHMIPCLGDDHEHVRGNAQARIAELTGCDPRELQQGEAHARRWWEAHRDGYRDDTLYLMGEPLDLARLVAMGKSGDRTSAEWFQLATGTFRGWPMYRFGYERFLRDVDAWWASQGDRFRPGRLYRHGYELDVEAVCRPTT